MWGSSSKSKSKNAKIETLVGRNTEITGDVLFRGGMHVDGTVRGNVRAGDDNCVVSVSQHGVIEGDVKVPHIVLDGTVTGDVHSSERLELEPHAKVNGDVYYNLVEMTVGASVNGKLVHKPSERPLLQDKSRGGETAKPAAASARAEDVRPVNQKEGPGAGAQSGGGTASGS